MCTVDDTPPRGTLQPVLREPAGGAALGLRHARRPTSTRSAPIPRTAAVRYVHPLRRQRLEAARHRRHRRPVVDQRHADRRRLLHGRRRRPDPAVRPVERDSSRATRRPARRPLFGIWGTAADDLWAVGGDDEPDTGGVVWHYDGSDVDACRTSPACVPTAIADALQGLGPRGRRRLCGRRAAASILHFDGARWSLARQRRHATRCSPCTAAARCSPRSAASSLDGLILERKDDGTLPCAARRPARRSSTASSCRRAATRSRSATGSRSPRATPPAGRWSTTAATRTGARLPRRLDRLRGRHLGGRRRPAIDLSQRRPRLRRPAAGRRRPGAVSAERRPSADAALAGRRCARSRTDRSTAC